MSKSSIPVLELILKQPFELFITLQMKAKLSPWVSHVTEKGGWGRHQMLLVGGLGIGCAGASVISSQDVVTPGYG